MIHVSFEKIKSYRETLHKVANQVSLLSQPMWLSVSIYETRSGDGQAMAKEDRDGLENTNVLRA